LTVESPRLNPDVLVVSKNKQCNKIRLTYLSVHYHTVHSEINDQMGWTRSISYWTVGIVVSMKNIDAQ